MELPPVQLDGQPACRVREIDLESAAADLDPALLDRRLEAGAHHHAPDPSFEVTVAGVAAGDPLGEELLHRRRPPSRRPGEPDDAAIERLQRKDPPAKRIVDSRPAELMKRGMGREVDKGSGRCRDRDPLSGGEIGGEEGAGAVTLQAGEADPRSRLVTTWMASSRIPGSAQRVPAVCERPTPACRGRRRRPPAARSTRPVHRVHPRTHSAALARADPSANVEGAQA